MSKAAATIAKVAAVVAVAAAIAIVIVGTAGAAAPLIGALSLNSIAALAGAAAAVAGAIAQATAKPPDMVGSVSQVMIGKNMPVPYSMGRTYVGGMQVYDDSANGPSNYDRSQIAVLTAAGPVDSFEAFQADYSTITFANTAGGLLGPGVAGGFYGADSGYMWLETKRGARPETAHVAPAGRSALTGWSAASKLSGFASYRVTMEFDEKGVRYASGIPQFGVIGKWVKVYDPRQDSTYPGGAGACRFNDESTFIYGAAGTGTVAPGENPALHALTYARGRWIEKNAAGAALATPVKVLGPGLAFDEIDVAQFVELANICDANGWTVGGTIYELPGASEWDNLKRILQAAGAVPMWTGGKLGLRIYAPRVALTTVHVGDLADGELSIQTATSWRDKLNTIVPRVRLENQKWEYTQIQEITSATYLAEDGETKSKETQFDLVQDKDQGAELAALELVNSREFGPITLPLKPYFLPFQVGEALALDLPEAGLDDQLAVITGRTVDPQNGMVMLTLESETTAKYDFVLGRVGVAPPSASIFPPELLDQTVSDANPPLVDVTQLIVTSYTTALTVTITTAGVVTVSNHNRLYTDKTVAVTGGTVTPTGTIAANDKIGVFYDQESRAGGAVTYGWQRFPGGVGDVNGINANATNPWRHFICLLTVPTSGTGGGSSGTGGGGGTGGPPGGGGADLIEY